MVCSVGYSSCHRGFGGYGFMGVAIMGLLGPETSVMGATSGVSVS